MQKIHSSNANLVLCLLLKTFVDEFLKNLVLLQRALCFDIEKQQYFDSFYDMLGNCCMLMMSHCISSDELKQNNPNVAHAHYINIDYNLLQVFYNKKQIHTLNWSLILLGQLNIIIIILSHLKMSIHLVQYCKHFWIQSH